MTAGLFASVQPSSSVPGLKSVWFALFSVVVVVGAFCSQETWGLILLLSVTGRVTWGPTSFTSPLFCKIKTLDEYSRALEATVALPVMRSLKWERGRAELQAAIHLTRFHSRTKTNQAKIIKKKNPTKLHHYVIKEESPEEKTCSDC